MSGAIRFWFASMVFSCLLPTAAWSQDLQAEKLYAAGVHAFYRNDYSTAITKFDLATGFGSQDPRVYYFRGIAKLRQGRRDEARGDFQYGAQLETQTPAKADGDCLRSLKSAMQQYAACLEVDWKMHI